MNDDTLTVQHPSAPPSRPADPLESLAAAEARVEATVDLVAALSEMEEPTKAGKAVVRSQKGEFSYRYLELPDLLTTVRRAFAGHRLAVMQQVTTVDSGVQVVTVILHASGHSWSSPALFLRCAPDPQSIGGASTYGRRYSLAAMVGLAGAEDDDAGNVREPRQAPAGRATTVQVAARSTEPETARASESEPSDDLISQAQMRKLGALIGEWQQLEGRELDKTERRRLIGFKAGVEDPDSLESAKDLTKAQASTAIEALASEVESMRQAPASDDDGVIDGEVVEEIPPT